MWARAVGGGRRAVVAGLAKGGVPLYLKEAGGIRGHQEACGREGLVRGRGQEKQGQGRSVVRGC